MKSLLLLLCLPLAGFAGSIELSSASSGRIAQRIWQNESGGTRDGLTAWNEGENFASLGIGHFIWYPKGQEGPFEESFPAFVRFAAKAGRTPPALALQPDCPWISRADFQRAFRSPAMNGLRDFLAATVSTQLAFIVQRLEAALPKMLATAPAAQRDRIRQRFYQLAARPAGLYALIDYVNFKGEGTSPAERYHGQGWGLLQVLENMDGSDPDSFARSASEILTRRVKNSPPARHEERWLAGWKNRCATYRE